MEEVGVEDRGRGVAAKATSKLLDEPAMLGRFRWGGGWWWEEITRMWC